MHAGAVKGTGKCAFLHSCEPGGRQGLGGEAASQCTHVYSRACSPGVSVVVPGCFAGCSELSLFRGIVYSLQLSHAGHAGQSS